MEGASGIPSQSITSAGSEPTFAGRSAKRKRPGKSGEIELTLNDLPANLQYRIFWEMLDFPEHCSLRVVSRKYHHYLGSDWHIYQNVLQTCTRNGAPVAPGPTCAARISAAIAGGHRECISYLARELSGENLCGRKLAIVTSLFNASVVDPTHPSYANLMAARMADLWDRQLQGQPLTSHSEEALIFYYVWLARRSLHMPAFAFSLQLQINNRAVWGFCDLDVKQSALSSAILTAADPGLEPEHRKKLQIQRDLLWYLLAADEADWNSCQAHLTTDEGKQGLKALGLMGFVTLLEQQRLLVVSGATSKADADIAKNLMQLRGDAAHSPHLRALANLTLAYQRLLNRTHAITDEEACTFLYQLTSRGYLRTGVREQAHMLLRSFHFFGRYPRMHLSDLEVAQSARLCLTDPVSRCEHGLLFHHQVWAKDVLVRLKIDNRVDAISAQTAIAFAQSLSTEPRFSQEQRQFHLGAMSLFRSMSDDPAPLPEVQDADADVATQKLANASWENSEPGSPSRVMAALVLAKSSLRAMAQGRVVYRHEVSSIGERLREAWNLKDPEIERVATLLYSALDSEEILLSSPVMHDDARRFCRLMLKRFP